MYTLMAASVNGVLAYGLPLGIGLAESTATMVTVAWLAVIALVVVRILRVGTVVAEDGITRQGFLVRRHHLWSDVHEFELTDRKVVNTAYGIQVGSRYVVTVSIGPQRRRRILVFLDERAFAGLDRFQHELNAVAALWEQRRQASQ
ncbi:hypothetical protein [Spirillospora albida]|uniref:hypothetical protein n=1 Tax=Spirillospora albida TaxID=58123 RepID=UPI0004C2701A|nr:hypothetical protein [Spirillospora albida]